jgi:hypothetical protein
LPLSAYLTHAQLAEEQHLFRYVIIPVMTEEHEDEDSRAGAVLEVRDCRNRSLLFIRGGSAPEDKFATYEENAKAKNDALEEHPEFRASWQVHQGNTSEPPYPGAIRSLYNDRFSISGFTWQRDTYGSLWLAVKSRRTNYIEAAEIADLCGIRDRFREVICKLNARHRRLLAA